MGMKLKDFLSLCSNDFEVDTTDTIFDFILNIDKSTYASETGGTYEKFIKVFYNALEITEIRGNNYICPLKIDYTKLIKNNFDAFMKILDINFFIEDKDNMMEDDFIYSWLNMLLEANNGNLYNSQLKKLIEVLDKAK